MENYIASLEKEISLIENGFKEEEKRALSDYRSNDKEFVKKLVFSAYNSNTYQVRMYGVFLFGYLSEQNDILTFMRDEVSKDDNWRVQEVLAKAFDEFCKNTGYEKAKHGTELAQDTYKNIETIIKKVETTDNKMEEISTAMKEQALATNEINVTMETIANNSTEINHLSMQHNEALDSVSEYLNGSLKNVQVITVVSDALNNLVQVFTVDKGKKATEINAIPWKNKYSVSVTSIDDQHKQLVNLINELNNAMLYEKGRDKISQIIKGLVDYTVFHFDYEEGLLKKNGYTDFDNHKKIHTKFIDAIKDFQNDFEYNEKELSKEVMDFLKRWLIEHIMGTDQKYSELLVKNKQN